MCVEEESGMMVLLTVTMAVKTKRLWYWISGGARQQNVNKLALKMTFTTYSLGPLGLIAELSACYLRKTDWTSN